MIIVNLKGGLGNQMFQYALAYVISKRSSKEIFCDTRLQEEYKKKPPPRNVPRDIELDLFNINIKTPKKLDLIKTMQFSRSYRIRNYIAYFLNKFQFLILKEGDRIFDRRVFEYKHKNLYLDGYWQSEMYFKNFRKEIVQLYNFDKVSMHEENINFIKTIDMNHSVCINVRRTDFLNNPEHNVVDLAYYKKALNLLVDKIGKNLEVFVFSDDLDWCKKNFTFHSKVTFMENNRVGDRFYNYLYLMSCFKNFIIPNSSFAWWGAWLSNHPSKVVIVPKKWSGLVDENKIDIVPKDWIRV